MSSPKPGESPTDAEVRLSAEQIFVYALPAIGTSMTLFTVGIFLPKFYTDVLLVDAARLSWVFLAGRVWDAITDPLMGHLSDRTRSALGRRRPYFLISAIPLAVVFYFLWTPSPGLSERGAFLHLLVCYLVLYTFWTIFNVPYIALGAQMTGSYHERTRLFGARQAVFVTGMALSGFLPQLFVRYAGGDDRAGYSLMGGTLGALTAVLILVTFVRVRENPEFGTRPPFPFFRGLGVTFRNRAFVVLLLVYLSSWVGNSFLAPLTPYMAQYVLKTPWAVPFVLLCFMGSSVASIWVWVRLSKRYGKKKVLMISMAIAAVGYLLSFTYHEGTWVRWLVLAVIVGAAAGGTAALGPAMSADVIDLDELETGRRREGAFFGVWAFVDKAAIGLALFVGLQALHWIGYEPNVEQSPTVILGLKVLYCVLPGACHVIAVLLLQKFPITPEVHAGIRAALAARAPAAETDGAQTGSA